MWKGVEGGQIFDVDVKGKKGASQPLAFIWSSLCEVSHVLQ
jgi:hypothetical protein